MTVYLLSNFPHPIPPNIILHSRCEGDECKIKFINMLTPCTEGLALPTALNRVMGIFRNKSGWFSACMSDYLFVLSEYNGCHLPSLQKKKNPDAACSYYYLIYLISKYLTHLPPTFQGGAIVLLAPDSTTGVFTLHLVFSIGFMMLISIPCLYFFIMNNRQNKYSLK